jgi:hypothetical protein
MVRKFEWIKKKMLRFLDIKSDRQKIQKVKKKFLEKDLVILKLKK